MRCTLKFTEKNIAGLQKVVCVHEGCNRLLWLKPDMDLSKVFAKCGVTGSSVEFPGRVARLLSFTDEYAKWVKAGQPKRTPEQIAANQQICEDCEFYVNYGPEHYGACKLCGCSLNNNNSVLNKHYMGTTKCPFPAGAKWLPIVDLEHVD